MRLKPIKVAKRKITLRRLLKLKGTGSRAAPVAGISAVPEAVPVLLDESLEAQAASFSVLVDNGLLEWLLSVGKKEKEAKTVVQRSALFVNWTYLRNYKVNISDHSDLVMAWFKDLITTHYDNLLTYATYLQNTKLFKPQSIKNTIRDIVFAFKWLTHFAPAEQRIPMWNLAGAVASSELVNAQQTQVNRHNMSVEHTEEEKIRVGQLPQDGLTDLQGAVHSNLTWARSLASEIVDTATYRNFVRLMYAAIYVFSPNGRQSGVTDMKWRQKDELLGQGYATSRVFKTNHKFGYQPVTLSEVAYELVAFYIATMRPQVSRPWKGPGEEPLWLTYRGKAEDAIGKHVTAYFIPFGWHITITTIRSCVETHMHRLMLDGKITARQRSAVMNINGHSSATTKDHYLHERRHADVHSSRSAFAVTADRILATAAGCTDSDFDSNDEEEHIPELVPDNVDARAATATAAAPETSRFRPSFANLPRVRAQPVVADWGTQHPDYFSNGQRARWTATEVEYIGAWCANFAVQHPGVRSVVARCLKHIRNNDYAISIFHRHHTLDSARLRNGHRQYLRQLQLQLNL